jgi:hypothetical protein
MVFPFQLSEFLNAFGVLSLDDQGKHDDDDRNGDVEGLSVVSGLYLGRASLDGSCQHDSTPISSISNVHDTQSPPPSTFRKKRPSNTMNYAASLSARGADPSKPRKPPVPSPRQSGSSVPTQSDHDIPPTSISQGPRKESKSGSTNRNRPGPRASSLPTSNGGNTDTKRCEYITLREVRCKREAKSSLPLTAIVGPGAEVERYCPQHVKCFLKDPVSGFYSKKSGCKDVRISFDGG